MSVTENSAKPLMSSSSTDNKKICTFTSLLPHPSYLEKKNQSIRLLFWQPIITDVETIAVFLDSTAMVLSYA
jgi:hypothetical protein